MHTNLKNQKKYIGITKLDVYTRWNNGLGYKKQPKMWNDIQNSDWNKDWIHGILGKFENEQDALKYESFLIAMLDTVRNGYNTSAYSFHSCKHSEETKRKMSEAQTGEKHPLYGKHHSEETRKKISDSKPKKPVLQFSKNGEFIAEDPSAHEAERQTGCYNGSICQCCKGKRKSCGGYIWKYKL